MGIMGGKNKISNIEISRGREYFRIKSILKRYFDITDIKTIFYVIEDKHVYQIILDDDKSFRLDMYEDLEFRGVEYREKKFFYHKVAFDNKINVPEPLAYYKTPVGFYKYSKWIEGKRIGYFWNLPELFRKAGKEIAKIHLIKDPSSDKFLGYNDFSKPNAIWTKDKEIFLVDVEIQPKKDVDANAVKILLKNIRDKDRIKWFIRGYREYRDPTMIIKELEKKNYKW